MAFDGQFFCFVQFVLVVLELLGLLLYQLILVVDLGQHVPHLLVGLLLRLRDDVVVQLFKLFRLLTDGTYLALQLGLFVVQTGNDRFLLREHLILSFFLIRLQAQERQLIKLVADKGDLAAKLGHKVLNRNV